MAQIQIIVNNDIGYKTERFETIKDTIVARVKTVYPDAEVKLLPENGHLNMVFADETTVKDCVRRIMKQTINDADDGII